MRKKYKNFSEKAITIMTYLQDHNGEDLTAKDIAAAVDMEARSITGVINGLVKKGFVERVVVEGEKDKRVVLTAAGAALDPEAPLDEE